MKTDDIISYHDLVNAEKAELVTGDSEFKAVARQIDVT